MLMIVSASVHLPDGEQIDLHFCCFQRVIKLSTLKGKITLNWCLHYKLSPCSQKNRNMLLKFRVEEGRRKGEEPFSLPMIYSKTLFYLQDHILEVRRAQKYCLLSYTSYQPLLHNILKESTKTCLYNSQRFFKFCQKVQDCFCSFYQCYSHTPKNLQVGVLFS